MDLPNPTRKGAEPSTEGTLYDAVGGRPFFDALSVRFFEAVEKDPILRPLYPYDLTEPIKNTAGFMAQFWGGGSTHYSDERGHPRLRMRHAPFRIGPAERQAWLHHMVDAVHSMGLPPELEARMIDYFDMATAHLINVDDEPAPEG